jgi:hypothetical protein
MGWIAEKLAWFYTADGIEATLYVVLPIICLIFIWGIILSRREKKKRENDPKWRIPFKL